MAVTREFMTAFTRLPAAVEAQAGVIPWACPVPYFGALEDAMVATVGLNPSNLEFVDSQGLALRGATSRFPTLDELKLSSWSLATSHHASLVEAACTTYFSRNPYDRWFKPLDYLISGLGVSYYFPTQGACHLDLVPYATSYKWGALAARQQVALAELSGDVLAHLLQHTKVHTLVLNGRAVVRLFEAMAGITLNCHPMAAWALPRRSGTPVPGFAYEGIIMTLAGLPLGRPVRVLGYNHNIQSSFGITTALLKLLRNWITQHALISI